VSPSPPQTHCPTCKQRLPSIAHGIILDIGTFTLTFNNITLGLSATKFRIAQRLIKHFGHPVATSDIEGLLYDTRDDADLPKSTTSNVRVHMCQLRSALKPLGLMIHSRAGRGTAGYRLDVLETVTEKKVAAGVRTISTEQTESST
jgi:DNA-binding response OmpR family regulator